MRVKLIIISCCTLDFVWALGRRIWNKWLWSCFVASRFKPT